MDGITGTRRGKAREVTLGDMEPRSERKAKTDEDKNKDTLRNLMGWWDEAREYHAENRREQLIDADFYDNHQYDPESAQVLIERGQFPSVYNLIALALDWIIGTERRTRIEGKIHPRGPEDGETANAKQQVLKYVDDVNFAGFERSRAFEDAAKIGVGWLEECVVNDPDVEPIAGRHVDWKLMWWDPFAKRLDLRDARYITRRKWVDLEYAQALLPEHAGLMDTLAKAYTDIELGDADDLADVPAMFLHRNLRPGNDGAVLQSGTFNVERNWRRRLALNETWFKRPVPVKRMSSLDPDLNRIDYDESNESHKAAVHRGLATLTDAVAEHIWVAIWTPGHLLSLRKSPYRHARYPFTPIWCKREDRTGLPYGYIRGARDAQMDYNKRRAKTLFLLSVNRVLYEDGAFDAADEDDMLLESARPDARIKVRKGALSEGRIKFEWGQDLAQGQMSLMEAAKQHILEGSGITRENLGQESNAISGRAVIAKQQQGATATAGLFDNFRFAIQVNGQKKLSLIEQYMTLPKRMRILGPGGNIEWLTVNEPAVDPETGEVFFRNDLAASAADFVVDQQDYRESYRLAMAEKMMETVGKLPPESQMMMLDLAVEMMDIPNREEWLKRIRALSGMQAPGQEKSPEDIEAEALAKEEERAAVERESAMTERERMAKIEKDMAAAAHLNAQAKQKAVLGKKDALDTAALVAAAAPMAPAADRIYQGE